ncbi:MAG: type II toxin-antitoxin system RelE/ParE family toxin [Alphaproteobacteria bacterium]|nr:type II toxin-antitoxin system RelE/ParE family toxin [Alphaproteobacteria bacterium]
MGPGRGQKGSAFSLCRPPAGLGSKCRSFAVRFSGSSSNPFAADRLLRLIAVVISRLQRFPFIGASREELGAGVRSIRVRPFPHLIFYRVDGETITLIRLLHGARDFPSAGIDS